MTLTVNTKTLYKIGCQCSHFVFRFFREGAGPPASSSSSSSTTYPPGIPHSGMFKLHRILEDWITENTTGMLSLTSRKWTASLVEIYCDQRSITGITAFLSNLKEGNKILRQSRWLNWTLQSKFNIHFFTALLTYGFFLLELCVHVQRNAPLHCIYYMPSSILVLMWDLGPELRSHTPRIVQSQKS